MLYVWTNPGGWYCIYTHFTDEKNWHPERLNTNDNSNNEHLSAYCASSTIVSAHLRVVSQDTLPWLVAKTLSLTRQWKMRGNPSVGAEDLGVKGRLLRRKPGCEAEKKKASSSWVFSGSPSDGQCGQRRKIFPNSHSPLCSMPGRLSAREKSDQDKTNQSHIDSPHWWFAHDFRLLGMYKVQWMRLEERSPWPMFNIQRFVKQLRPVVPWTNWHWVIFVCFPKESSWLQTGGLTL